MNHAFASAVVCTALAWTCSNAFAQGSASASASLSNIHFQLVDLNPQDGITPWLQLAGDFDVDNQVSLRAYANDYSWHVRDDLSTPGPYTAASVADSSNPAFTAAASISGDPFLGTSRLAASANSNAGYGDMVDTFAALGTTTSYIGFFLSPNTAFLISGLASVSASTEGSYDQASASSAVYMFLNTTSSSHLDSSMGGTQSLQMDIALVNYSNAPEFGGYGIEVDAHTTTYGSSPVPEPGGGALMLAGLAALPLLRRRQRSEGRVCVQGVASARLAC